MSKLKVGKTYKDSIGRYILIVSEDLGNYDGFAGGRYTHIGLLRDSESSRKGILQSYDESGRGYLVPNLLVGKTITIDGKDIEISDESFQELKKQLTEG